jgi:hypothetical protein
MDPEPPSTPDERPPPGPSAVAPTPPAPSPPRPEGGRTPPLPQLVTELRDLVVTYVKQQTLVPLQQLGRYIGFGLLGSLLLGFGVVFLGLSGLRALQTETGSTFTGNWSWVPYVIMVVTLMVGGAIVWLVRSSGGAEKGAR